LPHGDLHGGNIIYSEERQSVAFIDFQHTGFHYLFKDFISFESSARLEFGTSDDGPDDEALGDLIEAEYRLIEQGWQRNGSGSGYVAQIAKIRETAHSNFPEETLATYLLATISHCLYLVEKSERWAPYKRRRLIAAILAGVRYLQSL
jgi:hypothetical protein